MEGYGRFQAYYNRIRSEVEAIKADNKYSNLSKAFAHWYLERNENLSEQELGECIIDGFGDNGIDAITYKDNTMTLFQFKFPDRIKNIDKCIDEITALKLINGYNKRTANRKPSTSNERFMAYREIAKTTDIFSYRMVFVSFQQGFSGPARDAIDASISEVKRITGNDLHVNVFEKRTFVIYMTNHNVKTTYKLILFTLNWIKAII